MFKNLTRSKSCGSRVDTVMSLIRRRRLMKGIAPFLLSVFFIWMVTGWSGSAIMRRDLSISSQKGAVLYAFTRRRVSNGVQDLDA